MFQRSILTTLVLAAAAPIVHAQTSCAPLGVLPGYVDSDPADDLRAWNTVEFATPDDAEGAAQSVMVSGRYCAQALFVEDGVEVMSDLEIQSNYRSQLDALGATYFVKENQRTVASASKSGKEYWIDISSGENWIETKVVERSPHVPSLRAPTASDHPAFGAMPGYSVDDPQRKNFDQHEFAVMDGEDAASVNVQGKYYFGSYYLSDESQVASDADIQENYRAAIRKLGGEILYADSTRSTGRYAGVDGAPVWVDVSSGERWYEVRVVEEKPFRASIEPPKADALKAALDKDGRVALYINFEFGKSALGNDSREIVAQVLALLKNDPALELSIEGHTDDVGSESSNLALSSARAKAVMDALLADGIAAPRLSAQGFGEGNPIADNATSEGRARNRRVELVKR